MQLLLSTVCLALTSAVIGNAYYQKKQFYPAVVYITKSNASMTVIYIQFFVIVFMFGKLLRKIFLGTLRAAEFEHLLERFWYAITETCLAFTVFRDDFNPRFVALFTVLLFLKSFHWLAEERVDFMERSPVLGWLFHIRVASLLTLLGIFDYILLMHASHSTLERGPTVQLVFGFEYSILLTVVASTAIKYVLHTAEMRTDTPWENKAVFLLYTELVIGLIKVILYVLFVVIMVKIYALPMFVFRPMFFTIRNFKKALSDVIMSRRAIRNMNTLYPDATAEELRLSDNICIICREDMLNHSKKLPCGHIFHTACLRSWFQRQQTCPTCRLNILRAPVSNSTALPRVDDPAAGAAAAAGVGAGAAAAAAPPVIGVGGVAGVPPNILPGVGLAAPLLVPQQAANLPATAGTTTTVSSDGTTTTTTTTSTNIFDSVSSTNFPNVAGGMPMLPPPFMMPPPFPFVAPYGVPTPPMPPDLTNLSDEELNAMEGTTRKHVEERIKLLRNIQVMLDAAGVLMSNYQIITSRLPAPTPAPASATTTNATSASATTSAAATEQPSTSTAAAAAAATLFNGIAAPLVDATAMQQQPQMTSPSSSSNDKSSTVTATTTPANIENASNSTTLTTTTTTSVSSTLNKLNNVTIEDIPGDVDDVYVTSTQQITTINTSSSPTITNEYSNTSDHGDTTELSELRRRRIKFLEERNKSPTSTSTTR